jgi:enediyne biosynthesis protein E4
MTLSLSNNLILISLSIILFTSCSSSPELVWVQGDGYQWAEISPGYFGSTGFNQLRPSRTNIHFNNSLTEEEFGRNRNFLIGSGVAAGDINGDGFVDLYFTGLRKSNRLYKNLGGMKFEDITDQAGVAHEEYSSTGAVFADINGNGHLDLLVTSLSGDNILYINDGQGNFSIDKNSGLGPSRGSTTMALADITGNGYLDLYITNYKERPVSDMYTSEELSWPNILNEPLRSPSDQYTLAPPFDSHYQLVYQDGQLSGLLEYGEIDELYLNEGGKFVKVNDTQNTFLDENEEPYGLQPDWGLSAKFQDLNGNGHQDLYVCNDFFTPDRIWFNRGDGTFKAVSPLSIRNISYSCMGVDFSDINRNGRMDIFTTEMLSQDHSTRLRQAASEDPPVPVVIGETDSRPMYNRNSMHIKREDDTWAEITHYSGVQASGWSWATQFMDINLNGFEDLIINNGFLYDHLDIDAQIKIIRRDGSLDENFLDFMLESPTLNLRNHFFMNNGDLTFTDVSEQWGFKDLDISHGLAVADLNNNGTLDFVVNRMNQTAAVFQNTTTAPRISVRLKGKTPNTQAIGSTVELIGGPVKQSKQVVSGGQYSSGSDPGLMFAADQDNSGHEIIVKWPDGNESRIQDVKANRIYLIDQAGAKQINSGETINSDTIPIFEDISTRISHTHHEDIFDDFELQPLLPIRLSQLGPGVSWMDITGNGLDDLLIAPGRGGNLGVFQNQGNLSFNKWDIYPLTETSSGDKTTILGWSEDGYKHIVVGMANYELGRSGVPSAYTFKVDSFGTIIATDSIPGIFSTTGPMAAADVTGNGYLDLFIGGGFKPGQYPEDADSRFFRNEGGFFILDSRNSQLFNGLGLVNGAVFSDITGNGQQDLLVSTGWGTLRLFENNSGVFREVTAEFGLADHKGWWQGVATGDLNGNGRTDIIAMNLGLNSQYQFNNDDPLRLYFDNFDGFGGNDIIDAYSIGNQKYMPRQKLHEFQQSYINLNRMENHEIFANSSLKEILGDRYEQTRFKEINTLEHMVFINTDDGFEAHSLPLEAQLSAGYHVGVADINNNGIEDLFISQNLFALPEKTPRLDAGRGLLLFGNGDGSFRPVSGTESGIKVYGEQRGAAFSDLNNDGRLDLTVSQNGTITRLFLNQTDKRGFRISLHGPSSNSEGVGSQIRLIYENGEKGPARHIQIGSGYWSQNSTTQILGAKSDNVKAIEIQWYNGTLQIFEVEKGEKDFTIHYPEKDS